MDASVVKVIDDLENCFRTLNTAKRDLDKPAYSFITVSWCSECRKASQEIGGDWRVWRLRNAARKRENRKYRLTSCTCFVLSRSSAPPKINLQNRIKRRKRRVMESIRANFAVRFCPRSRMPYKRNTHCRKTLMDWLWDLVERMISIATTRRNENIITCSVKNQNL